VGTMKAGMSTLESRIGVLRRKDEPVTVVGAGPAGLACAIALARAGWRVVVREWHRYVGMRFHGDFQGIENWSDERDVLDELRAGGIEINFAYRPVSEVTAFDNHRARYRIQGSRPLYYLVRRGRGEDTADEALLRQAIAAGAEVRFDDRVDAIGDDAVLATGPRRADAIAVGYLFNTDLPDGNWVVFDNRLAPLGYGYLLIHGGRGTIASCMFTGFKKQAEHIARTVAFFRDRVGLEMRNPQSFGGFANFRLPRTALQGGHPVVGEQAGFQDALAGFGMRYALRSGRLAAESIIHGIDYTSLWRRDLLPLLRTGTVNRFVLNLMGERGRRYVIGKLSQGDASSMLRRLYQPSMLG
ncbi:NAD(P)/FAD-dependent oxidoreductase, partial [Methyloceanibacter sp.]|uniref:NAD(P)/FAD-dependent oxidoreductase n=1 Tax=Methyloceanibacter sp. TaxID=1965321 RepID=UPI002D43C9FF